MTQLAVEVTGDDRSAAMFLKLQARVKELESNLRGMGAAAQKSGKDLTGGLEKGITTVASMAAGYLSLSTVINVVSRNIETMNANMAESVGAQDKLLAAMRPVLASAPGAAGAATAQQVMALGRDKGFRDTAIVLKSFDELEDAMGGDTAGAIREFAEVLDVVKKTGEFAGPMEIATRAAGFTGADPGQVTRQAWIAGERFKVSPELLSKAMSSAERMGKPEEGMALAAMFASQLHGRKAIGAFEGVTDALSGTDEKTGRRLQRQFGITAEMSLFDKLDRFASAGIDTQKEFQAIFKDGDKARHLEMAVAGLPRARALAAEMATGAGADRFASDIAAMGAATPAIVASERRAGIAAETEMLQLTGPSAGAAADRAERLGMRGRALREAGIEKGVFGSDLIDAEGRLATGLFAKLDMVLSQFLSTDFANRIYKASENLMNASSTMRGGPAMVPATEDK